jgi:uroporphyrinogen-III synthase
MARQSRPAVMPPFLLTRPNAQGDRFADALRARFGPDLRIVTSPLMVRHDLTPALPDDVAGLIFTSETGVAALGRLRPAEGLPAWCVGDRTAQAARQAGYEARSAAGDATALVALILAEAPPGPLLHARGEDSRGAVAERLTAAGIPTTEALVYAQRPKPLTAEARRLLEGADAVILPLFSPRTALLLAAELAAGPALAPLWIVALSPAVAEAAAPLAPARHAVAATPDAVALLDAAEALIAASAQS